MLNFLFKFKSRNVVYFRVPKTASSSLLIAFRKADSVENTKIYDSKAFTFTFVRNPYDRLVSAYKHLILRSGAIDLEDPRMYKGMSFEEFVKVVDNTATDDLDVHVRPQWTFIPKTPGFLGKFENLKEDYLTICRHIGIKKIPELGWQNSSKKVNFEEFYTKKIKKVVRNIYETDFELFGYNQ